MSSSYPSVGVVNLLLSPTGTIGRTVFALGAGLLTFFALVADSVLGRIADGAGIVGFLFALTIAWSAGCLSRKRLHDIGWSGMAIALFLGAYIFVVLAVPFLPPMPGRGAIAFVLIAGPASGWVLWLLMAPGIERSRKPSGQPVVLA